MYVFKVKKLEQQVAEVKVVSDASVSFAASAAAAATTSTGPFRSIRYSFYAVSRPWINGVCPYTRASAYSLSA